MDMKQRRKGALTAKPCALCGSLVDERDLVMSEVQGLRGSLVCSAHPWEREARVKPSFQDRGGVGQVPDLSIEPIWPGSNGGWIEAAYPDTREDDMAIVAYKASDTARGSTITVANDPDLFAGITEAGTYLVRVWANFTSDGDGIKFALDFSGTITSVYGDAGSFSNVSSVAILPMTAFGSTFDSVLGPTAGGCFFEVYFVASSAGTINFQWAQVNSDTDPTTVKFGSYMSLTQLA